VAIKDDIINAGAEYTEERCVTDGNMCVSLSSEAFHPPLFYENLPNPNLLCFAKHRRVSAQTPDDLPEFMKAVLAAYSKL